ncbi:MAG: hypothetical protein L3K19_00195 [Thermoplasmata archaeon]|nr:hypothetical protein [Thermoplasmata archaeon]
MSPKSEKTTRTPRGAQKWIVAELRGLEAGAQISTSKIAKRIAKASGKTFHVNSVYLALRKLVERGEVAVSRKGVQKLYSIATAMRGAKAPAPNPAPFPVVAAGTVAPRTAEPVLASSKSSVAPLPHKLAVGEVLVLEINEKDVLTATNVHGEVVIERHAHPS